MRFILKSLCVISTFTFAGQSSQGEAHQSGQSFASSLMGAVTGAARSTNPHEVPGFQTDRPQEVSLESGALGEAAFQVSKTNDAAQHIISEAKDRKSFKIDPNTDPLFVGANEVIANPQKAMDEEFIEAAGSDVDESEEIKTCEEGGEETLEEGLERRIVTVAEPPKHTSTLTAYSHGWSGGLSRNIVTGEKYDASTGGQYYYAAGTTIGNPLPANLQSRFKSVQFRPGYSCPAGVSLYPHGLMNISTSASWGWRFVNFTAPIEITLKPGEEDIAETIDSTCHALEEKVDKGLCAYEDEVIVEGPQ